jgi:hypothetical protein
MYNCTVLSGITKQFITGWPIKWNVFAGCQLRLINHFFLFFLAQPSYAVPCT